MIEEYLKNCPSYNHWKKIGIHHHHGFCLPLFSLTSQNSCGIGEFLDLLPLIDWCKKIHADVIQLLPLNEAYYKDPSPYNAISSCALDPIYISLQSLPYIDENLKNALYSFKKYTITKKVKHNIVRRKKFLWLRRYFDKYFDKYLSQDYEDFKSENSFLYPYSIFRTLKEKQKGKKWYRWPKDLQNPTDKTLDTLSKMFSKDIEFFTFLQYLCFSQMKKVKKYADKKKVFLKGDIPILINPDSSDVWYERAIFDMSYSAGAPPDDFNKEGHKWGFPLFKWNNIKKDNYAFWKRRLDVIKDIYHIYRIDHAVGFFRIWAIPPKKKASQGEFLPKDPSKWEDLGRERFQMMLDSSSLFPIAEDLGFIPSFVYTCLKSLGICGTKVPRWENKPLKNYEPISLTTLSTHDTETLELFWKKRKKAKKLCKINNWTYKKKLTFDLRKKILYDTHRSSSLFHINLLGEYLALFKEFVWKNPKQERINRSGVISRKNWTYRFKKPIEEFTSSEKLNNVLKEIIS